MRPARTAVAVAAALTLPLGAAAPAAAQEATPTTSATDAAADMADAVEADCAAVTAIIPVPSRHDADAPSGNGSGIFTEVVNPVAGDGEAAFEPIFIPYQARGEGDDPAAAYSQTLTDGYARLTQVSHRVISQCPDTKLALLGQGQGGHLVSVFAAEIGRGAAAISDESVAFAATISDPTRAAGQTLFPGVPGQSAPVSWTGTSSRSALGRTSSAPLFERKTTSTASSTSRRPANTTRRQTTVPEQETSVKLYADLATVPEGSGLNHQAQQITDFGTLTGRVAQVCVTGDLSCSAPVNAALGRAALAIMDHAGTDFSRDPLAAANSVAQSLTATAASGVARHAAEGWEGDTIGALAPTGELSVSERIEQAATPRIRTSPQAGASETSTVEDSVAALNRAGSIGINAATAVAGDVLDESTIAALLEAGITGGATSPALTATLTARAGESALKLIEPRSLGPRLVSVFEALTSNITDNAELPELIAAARTWDRLATEDGYRSVPIAASGETVTEVLADWLAAAVRDNTPTAEAEQTGQSTESSETSSSTAAPTPARTPKPLTQAVSVGPKPTDTYLRDQERAVIPAGPKPQAKAYELTTVASETGAYEGPPISVSEASSRLVSGNADYTAAQQLAFLADPAYPVDSPLAGVTQAGAHVAITNGRN
jgi:hypothetical protein